MSRFTDEVVQAWINQMRAKTHGKKVKRKYQPKTIINIHGSVISPVFEFAVFKGYCGTNPCRWVKLPERKGRPIKAHHVLFPPPGTHGGWLWRNSNFNSHRWQKVKKIARKRGLTKDPSPHRLRHAHATALIPLHGIESVSKRIGHANVTVTSTAYSHLTPATDARMATSLDGVLRRPRKAS